MTSKEKANIKRWNIEMGQAKEEADKAFKELQDTCRENGLSVYCCAETNYRQLVASLSPEVYTKAGYLLARYYESKGKWEDLVRFLTLVGNC